MANLFDLLSDEDRQTVKKWGDARRNPKHKTDIPPELYTVAELGYYLGWGAVEACMRGYIEYRDAHGELKKSPFTLDQHVALTKACQKVWYRKLIDSGDIMTRASVSSRTAEPIKSFRANMKSYEEEAAF